MCINYAEGKCAVEGKACKKGEAGKDLAQGGCDLHGEFDLWHTGDKVVVTNTGAGQGKPLARGVNFLTADEQAYKRSRKLKVPVEYVLKEKG